MISKISYNNQSYTVDLSKPLDISIPLKGSKENVNAWYIGPPKIAPVVLGEWIGAVSKGSSTNFNTITFNPHAHGTHTECVGHITKKTQYIIDSLKQFFFITELVSITPQKHQEDLVITKAAIQKAITQENIEALVIRTLPNPKDKLTRQYSNTNWPYLTKEATIFIRELGIQHLLIDLPSVDKEKDEGRLEAHKAFWNYPENPRHNATITEMIFVENNIKDGLYLLNLQVISIENDASPSKPVLYQISY